MIDRTLDRYLINAYRFHEIIIFPKEKKFEIMRPSFLIIHAIMLLGSATLGAQSSFCHGSYTCDQPVWFCEISDIDGFECSSFDVPNVSFPKVYLCDTIGVPHNIQWWKFIATDSFIRLDLEVDFQNCSNRPNSGGLQAGIWKDCDGSEVIACEANTGDVGRIRLEGDVIPCESYVLWIDGINADICDFKISVVDTNPPPQNLPDSLLPLMISDCTRVGDTVTICSPDYQDLCGNLFGWSVIGSVELINPSTSSNNFEHAECIQFIPKDTSTIIYSLIVSRPSSLPGAGCDSTFLSTWGILNAKTKSNLASERLSVCYEDQPLTWNGIQITSSCIDPPCRTLIQDQYGCSYDTLQVIDFLPELDTVFRFSFVCEEGKDTCYEDVVVPDPITGCDQPVRLVKRHANYTYNWVFEDSPDFRHCPNIQYDPTCDAIEDDSVQIVSSWFEEASGKEILITNGEDCLKVDSAGTFCVRIGFVYKGDTCFNGDIVCDTINERRTTNVVSRSKTIDIFPSLSRGIINVRSELSPEHIAIYNMEGKEARFSQHNSSQLDISSNEPGIYFIWLLINGKIEVRKIVLIE